MELLRLRQTVAEYYGVILVALLLVAGVGTWAGYTAYLDPGVTTEERTVSTWSRTATFSHGAQVTRPNPIYDTEVRLTNQRAYFPRIAPFLEGEYEFSYTTARDGNADIITNIQLLVRSSQDGAVLWQSTQTLNTRETTGVKPDQAVLTAYRFNMSQVQLRLDRVGATLGDTPGETEVVVQAETRLTGEINGRTVNRRFVDNLRLIPDGDAFLVSDPGQIRNTSTQTEIIQRERNYSLLWKAGAPLLIVIGFGGAGGLVYARREGLLSIEARALPTQQQYSEWISHGTLPGSFDPDDNEIVELDSLGDLVDVAADINERVLYDSEYNCYAVLDDRYEYVYWPAPVTDTESKEVATENETPSGDSGEKDSPDQTL